MASWYYYNENGEKVGPVKDSEFKQLVRQGAITPKTLIETESGQKAKAEKVKGLFPSSPVSASVSVAASPIAFTCSSCGRSLKVKNELAGRTLRCPTCQSTITVPVGEPTPFSLPMTPDWGDAMANLLEESARMDAIKAQNEKERVLREAQPVRHPGSDAPVLITPEQLASKITLKNAKNVSGGILFLMLSAVFWLIDYLIVLAVSALFWIVIVNGDQQPESDYGAAIFFTSLVLFVLLGGLGYYYAHTVYTQERDERKTFGGDGFSLMFFFAGNIIAQEDNSTDDDLAEDEDPEFLREKLQAISAACEEYNQQTAESSLATLNERVWSKETKNLLSTISEHLFVCDFEDVVEVISKFLDE